MKSTGWFSLIVGVLVVAASFAMRTTMPGTGVFNLSLADEASAWRLVGLFIAQAGVILIAAGKIVEAVSPALAGRATTAQAAAKTTIWERHIGIVLAIAGFGVLAIMVRIIVL